MEEGELSRISTFQPCDSAYREYMRKSSPAKSEASSPPVPARISRITFLSSLGSFGSIRNFRSRSTISRRAVSSCSSSWAICFSSASSASTNICLVPSRPFSISFHSRYFATMSAMSACVLASFWKRAESLCTSGEESCCVSSSYRDSIFSSFWNSVKFAMAIPQRCRKSKREIGKYMQLHGSTAPAGSRGFANRTRRTSQSSLIQEYRQSCDASTQESQGTSFLKSILFESLPANGQHILCVYSTVY